MAAFQLFTKGAALGGASSMYMIGLCYRNGYGVVTNVDSAKFWLQKSAKLGYNYADEELASGAPENLKITNIGVQPSIINQNAASQSIKNGNGYKRVKQYLSKSDIDGEYFGYAIKFDYSGKNIIEESPLKLKLTRNKKVLTGQWIEDGKFLASINATLADSSIIFNGTTYSRPDHYNQKSPNDFEFKNASLQLVRNADTVYITGNLQLYSTKLKEPEKPTFVMLIRNDSKSKVNQLDEKKDSLNTITLATSKVDSIHFVAYPNPFSGKLQASFTLKKTCEVSMIVSNLMNGSIVYRQSLGELKAGEHEEPLYINGPPGTYVFTLNYGKQLKSQIIFKQ